MAGAFWCEQTDDKFSTTTARHSSSMRAELLAILIALIVVPSDAKINLFSDSQAGIDSVIRILGWDYRQIRNSHKWNNIDILGNIRYIIKSKNLDIHWTKVKGHSGISGNELVDDIAKTALAQNLDRYRLTNISTPKSLITINPL